MVAEPVEERAERSVFRLLDDNTNGVFQRGTKSHAVNIIKEALAETFSRDSFQAPIERADVLRSVECHYTTFLAKGGLPTGFCGSLQRSPLPHLSLALKPVAIILPALQ